MLRLYLAGVAFAAVAFGGWLIQHDRKVERAAVAKIEKVTQHAAIKGKRAAQRSTTASVRGPVDPTTRDD